MLKSDVALFSKLFVMQYEKGDTDIFLQHKNHPYPLSLSDSGKLRLGKKPDIVLCVADKNAKVAPSLLML